MGKAQQKINNISNEKSHRLILPYAGQKGKRLIKSMKKTVKCNLSNNIVTKSAYSASQLSREFNIKYKIKHDHHHYVTYYIKCPVETCREDYIGETGRRLSERLIDHSGSDKNSHVLKHCIEKKHKLHSLEDFIILGTNYKKNKFRRKISVTAYQEKTLKRNMFR